MKEGDRRASVLSQGKDFDADISQPHRVVVHLMCLKLRCFPRCSLTAL